MASSLQQPNDSSLYDKYRNVHTECRQLISDFEARRETSVVESTNLGGFYRFINHANQELVHYLIIKIIVLF